MRTHRPACTLTLLIALALHTGIGSAQQPMSPQDEAIYRQMVKTMGADPEAAMGATK